jgi:hypothetical protein
MLESLWHSNEEMLSNHPNVAFPPKSLNSSCLNVRLWRLSKQTSLMRLSNEVFMLKKGTCFLVVSDCYGNLPGSNSNTNDTRVQSRIDWNRLYAWQFILHPREKKSEGLSYWDSDMLVLDEAAQLDDSKLYIVLVQCMSLKATYA